MVDRHNIDIPSGVTKDLDDEGMERAIDVSLGLAPLWENALGPDWQRIMTRDKVAELLWKM